MVYSMTGFGQAVKEINDYKIQIEAKSVNHRYCEVMVRIPREWLVFEDGIKRAVQQTVKRGRVDVFVTIERTQFNSTAVELNWPLIDAYWQASEQLMVRYKLKGSLNVRDLLDLPDAVTFKESEEHSGEDLENALLQCLQEALDKLEAMRKREGAHLALDVSKRVNVLERFHSSLAALAPRVVTEYRDKLRVKINELLSGEIPADEQRFATEVAMFAERANIDEELTRLQSHFNQYKELLGQSEPIGRKLDFLIQEMNREVNTIGSKANYADISKIVVEMKAELEKIREQIQNIE